MIRITEQFLNNLLSHQTNVLMGKILKRIEIFENREDLKKSVKEILAEWVREIKYHLYSFNSGIESFEFKFKKENPTKEP